MNLKQKIWFKIKLKLRFCRNPEVEWHHNVPLLGKTKLNGASDKTQI